MNASALPRSSRSMRLLAVTLSTLAFLSVLSVRPAAAVDDLCHGGGVVYYGNFPGTHGCKYEEHAVYWTCAATDPETGDCWKYDLKQARWRGDTQYCHNSDIHQWRLMYARLIRISDGAIIWSIGWQPYQTNCDHGQILPTGGTYYFAGINKLITTPHAVTFKFEHVGVQNGVDISFNTWGRIDLYPGA